MGPGPSCLGPNCPPQESGKWGPGQLGPGNVPSKKPKNHQKNKTQHPKCKQGCIQISNMLPNIPNAQVKTQNISVQIPNNHPRSYNHHTKYQKYHLNHQIPLPPKVKCPPQIKFIVHNTILSISIINNL